MMEERMIRRRWLLRERVESGHEDLPIIQSVEQGHLVD